MRRIYFIAPLLATSVALASERASQNDKIVPVHQEPRHQLVFERPGTKILNVQIPPGDTTLFHTHSHPILYVNMSGSQTRSQTLGGAWSGGEPPVVATAPVVLRPDVPVVPATPPGRMMSVTSYAQQALTHRVHNAGTSLYWLIGITNESTGDESTAPSADFAAKPEIDNRWFRGYRWKLSPSAPLEHRHANPVAIVKLSGPVVVEAKTKATIEKYGSFAWIDGDVPHRLHGAGAEAEVIEVEVRRPR